MCRVLILDDEKTFAEYIKMILEDAREAQPDITTTPEEAEDRVRTAIRLGKPYEVLLIDQRLGKGHDGIEIMRTLRSLSPDSDAIILTGFDDTANGVRAYEAGAFRYLSKSFESRELIFLFKAIKQWRKEQREHGWQKVFGAMMEEALSKELFADVASTVVKYAMRLGFVRAHLFWVPTREEANANNQMVGITCAGEGCIPGFKNGKRLYPLDRWFDLCRIKQSKNVIFMRPEDSEQVQKEAEIFGYRWPHGENVILPLWSGTRLLGALMLDHDQQLRLVSEHERQLLHLFARQVSLALENASLYIREKRSREEADIIRAIGQHVTARAAIEDLGTLLDVVRTEVGRLINTESFAVVLFDGDSNEPAYRLLYEAGQRIHGIRRIARAGLEEYLMTHPQGLFLPDGVEAFVAKHQIETEGAVPTSWMGVPLKVSDEVIGGIILKHTREAEKFTERDWRLLGSVANQIAGAIALSRINESEKRDAERINVLRRSSMEMLRVARTKKEHLFTLAITLATAQFGTGFNRAMLFMEDETRENLVLMRAVGTEDPQKAHHDWERDEARGYAFDDFLYDLENDCLHLTDFSALEKQVRVKIDPHATDAFNETLNLGQYVQLSESGVVRRIPHEVMQRIQVTECAILPLNAGNRTIGLMLVDNKHNQKRLSGRALYRLQTILNYAGLVWETLRQQEKSDSLLDANYQILGSAGKDALKQTLKRICQTARTISEADWVIIYPLKPGGESFDKANISYDGVLQYPLEEKVKEKPRKHGVSAYVLQKQPLVVPDINRDQTVIDAHRLAEHHFIQREGVQALLGIAIAQVDGQADAKEKLGVLYLDYRKPHTFTEQDIHHARSIASLAAVALANARRFDQDQQRRRIEMAQKTAEIIYKSVKLDEMFVRVLENLKHLFNKSSLGVLAYYPDEKALRFVPSTLKFYRANPSERAFPIHDKSLAARVARDSLKQKRVCTLNEPNVHKNPEYLKLIEESDSELCVSLIDSAKNLLGVLVLENHTPFNDEDVDLVQTVAAQLSMGMERARQNDNLAFQRTVNAQTAWVADIAHDLKNELGSIKNNVYLIRQFAENDPEVLESVSAIDQSIAILGEADPQKARNKQPHSPDTLIKRYAGELAESKNIHVDYQLHTEDLLIRVSNIAFKKMMRHLIRNAARAMEGKSEKRIIISTRRKDRKHIEIRFQDFGHGIPEDVRPFLFIQPITTKKSGEGGGYGLLFIRQLVEDMGGSISLIHSDANSGTTFAITLPIHTATDGYPE